MRRSVLTIARELGEVGRDFYARGWALGTSGNFSGRVASAPLTLAITASAVPKGAIGISDIVVIDADARIIGKQGNRPSAEALLHVTVARLRGAGAVLHTHSVWSTILSEVHAARGGLTLTGYEMLKGLEGVTSHEHAEWVPILENDQDMGRLAARVEATLRQFPAAHAFLLRQHGLYTWGADVPQARRHVEILEFLLEASGRMRAMAGGTHGTGEDSGRTENDRRPSLHRDIP